jgi:hypothetical protein
LILCLSAAGLVFYGYALAGYAAYTFDRGRPDYVAWGLTGGTLCVFLAFSLWKKWLKSTEPDLLVFGDGFWETGAPLRKNWKDMGLPVGIYTRLARGEMTLALKRSNWDDFPEDMLISSDDGIQKPSPEGLVVLCQRRGAKTPTFFGTAASDMETWTAFGKGDFVAIGSLLKREAERGKFFQFDTLEEALSFLPWKT